jgi:hypothetical protein
MYSTKAMLFELVSMCLGCVPVYKDWIFSFMRHQTWRYNTFVPQVVFVSKPTEWKTEKLTLMHLEEVEIIDMNGTDH